MSRILCDMDGVLVDWGAAYNRALDEKGKLTGNIPRHEDQKTFNLHEGLQFWEQVVVNQVMRTLDYAGMSPIEGAVKAVHWMQDHGHDVILCTSPWLDNATCIPGKFEWVERHLGSAWLDRVVITRDKTIVQGDWLIDDKPEITGRNPNPEWIHVVYDQPYNQEVTGQPRIMSWNDWDSFARRFTL